MAVGELSPVVLQVHAGAMFDGERRHGPSTVRMQDGRITAVLDGPPPASARTVDLGPGVCLLPGLIDTHTHLALDAGADPLSSARDAGEDELLDRMRVAARQAMQAGITTVRDLGDWNFGSLTLAAESVARPETGPEIIAAGPPITTPGGYLHELGGVALGEGQLREAVRRRYERGGAAVMIVYAQDATAQGIQFTRRDLFLVVDEAHRLGLPVAVRADGTVAIADAVAAGADSIEHPRFTNGHRDDVLLDMLADSGIPISLPLGDGTPRPPAMDPAWTSLAGRGARLMVGTGAGASPGTPHDVLPSGVAALTRMGLSPVDALRSATATAAEACWAGARKGRIAVGADADILAVWGDPTADVARLRDVCAVFRAGIRVR